MNEVIKNMLTRVSVRKFTAERVEDEKLKTIVECAKASPTGKNRQMRKFTVVHNREKDTGTCKSCFFRTRHSEL